MALLTTGPSRTGVRARTSEKGRNPEALGQHLRHSLIESGGPGALAGARYLARSMGALGANRAVLAYTGAMTTTLVCTLAVLTALLHAAARARAVAIKKACRQLTPAHS